jgi:Zn finger protein HypA/HybF involved in hydrogenase expression
MLAEAAMGISALQTALNLVKGMKNLDTAVAINSAVIELQENILSAQSAQAALIERISTLEKEVAGFERWDAEKERYELKEIFPGSFARAIKENARGSEPAHLICTTCYEDRKKRVLQQADSSHLSCPECKTRIRFTRPPPPVVDRGGRGGGGPNRWLGR